MGGVFQLDAQVMAFPLPVPCGAGQHEIHPAGPPVLAQDGPRCGSFTAEQPAVLDEYFVEAAITDVQCVLLAEDPAAVLQDAVEFVTFLDARLRLRSEDEVFQSGEEVDAVGHRGRGFDQC